MTPFQVTNSRQVVLPIEIKHVDRTSDFNIYISVQIEAMTSIREKMLYKVASNIKDVQATQKHQYDAKRLAVSTYDVGEKVLAKIRVRQDSKSGHFCESWNGPYTISQ